MKVKYENSLKYNLLQRIQQLKSSVILRSDVNDLGSDRQVSRGLIALIKEGLLVRLGSGIYAKAKASKYYDKPIPISGFDRVAREALDRLGVEWSPGTAEKTYNKGNTTQIPTKNIVQLKTRCRRNISYEGNRLYFENNVNAK